MSLTKFTENTNVIAQLPDTPTLTSAQLKAKFDENGTAIKEYLNDTLTTEVEQLVATEKNTLQGLINALRTEIINAITEGDKAKYHVGKIILDTENINPATYLGFGTWELWGQGRVPVGVNGEDTDFNVSGLTGGEKTHTLTEEEMPSHHHNLYTYDGANPSSTARKVRGTENAQVAAFASGGTEYRGGGQPHNNLQPYITCYMWKRVS